MNDRILTHADIPAAPFYVTCTDKFMSGWGPTGGRNNRLVFVCATQAEACARPSRSSATTPTSTKSRPARPAAHGTSPGCGNDSAPPRWPLGLRLSCSPLPGGVASLSYVRGPVLRLGGVLFHGCGLAGDRVTAYPFEILHALYAGILTVAAIWAGWETLTAAGL